MKLKYLTAIIRRIERQLSLQDGWASKGREVAYKAAQRFVRARVTLAEVGIMTTTTYTKQ
jgi:hypothetical protein